LGQNPCDDTLLKELEMKIKSEGLESLNEREWSYYQIKSEECSKKIIYNEVINPKSLSKKSFQVQNSEDSLNFIATKVCCSVLIRIAAIIFVANLVR
tara:strand:- start:906 stop:1196 length:291 start_codon:yes stop_codon:yes gene_type:complete